MRIFSNFKIIRTSLIVLRIESSGRFGILADTKYRLSQFVLTYLKNFLCTFSKRYKLLTILAYTRVLLLRIAKPKICMDLLEIMSQ